MTIYVFRNAFGGHTSKLDQTGEFADFYKLITGRFPIKIEQLPLVQSEAMPKLIENIRHLSRNGQKIAAIKIVRALSDWGLRESKDWVELIETLA